jgi:type 1 glutamine amidotransferase
LIVWGGWDGHEPKQVAEIFRDVLVQEGFAVDVSDTLDAFLDAPRIMELSLIVPVWTMGKITQEQVRPVLDAVKAGTGIAGCHGGMCDSFREETEWQFMTGGQWVAHPGNDGVRYKVKIGPTKSPITEGINASEQYYMHVDPAVKVLATTRFPVADGPHMLNDPVDMPVIWTKRYGQGKVFYNSLGHHADVVASEPNLTIMRRGFLWASK